VGLADAWPVLLLLVVVLATMLRTQIRQRNALRRWLESPEGRDTPDGVGPWREIFSRLQRLRKEDQRAYQALERTLDRFRQAVQALPDGVILLDAQTHIEWLNASAGRQFSLDASRDVGTQLGHLVRQGEFRDLLASRPQRGASEPLLLRVQAQGREQVLSVMLIPFGDAKNLLLSRDVTELARTEAMRRDFVANVSHELRTPLTVISGFIEQFVSDEPPTGEVAARFFALMADQSERMTRLVADLLTLSQLENDNRPPPDETIDMAAMLESLRTEALALADGRLGIEISETSAGRICGSSHELRSAFGNLVSNAVRYTPAGGTVTLAWRMEEGCPTFSVADTGIGIPAEHIPRLTERFYRVDKGRSSATGGTGLGLAIVKHVLMRHQGTLAIRSEPGRGSVFSARLPAARRLP